MTSQWLWICFLGIFLIMDPCLELHSSDDAISIYSLRGNSYTLYSVKLWHLS